MIDIDKIAQAIWRADRADWEQSKFWSWEQVVQPQRDRYRRMAKAAVDSMDLTQQWAVQDGDRQRSGLHLGNTFGDRESAERQADRILSKWALTDGALPGGVLTKPNPIVVERFVSPWMESETT